MHKNPECVWLSLRDRAGPERQKTERYGYFADFFKTVLV